MPNTLRSHHLIALALSIPLVLAIAVDWVITGLTGERTILTNDEGPVWFDVANQAVLGLAFLALLAVLVRESDRFAGLGRVARGCRRTLLVGCPFMAFGLMVLYPVQIASGVEEGPLYVASGALATLALALTFIPAFVLGLTQLRSNHLGLGGRLLSLGGPAILLTLAALLIGRDWASPVLFTATVLLGLSLLGAGAPAVRPAPAPATTRVR